VDDYKFKTLDRTIVCPISGWFYF